MASLFGGLDPFPAYLRQDEGSFLRSFEMGAQVAERSQRLQLEKQRVLNDTATTAVNLQRQQSAMGIEALRNQEEATYQAFDIPQIVEFGKSISMKQTPAEVAATPLPAGLKTPKAIADAQKIQQSRLASVNGTTEAQLVQGNRALLLDALKDASPDVRIEALPYMSKPDWATNPESVSAVTTLLKQDRAKKQADLMDVTLQRRFSSPAAVEAWIADNPDATPEQIAAMRKSAAPVVRPSLDINPLSRAVDRYNEERKDPDSTPEQLKLRQQLLSSFARQRGEQVSFDEAGNPSIVQGVSPALRTKLESGINASKTALQFLDNLTPDKLDAAFGFGAAARDIGQAVGGANVGLGRTEVMTEVFQNLEAIKPLIRSAIQDEKGATTEGDVARASALIGGDFKRNSKQQAKQMVAGLREIFQRSMERQAGAIAKAPSVQKVEREVETGAVETVEVLPPNPTPQTLTTGKVYQTSRGKARWNGTAFERVP
jgi:hypothetical protein